MIKESKKQEINIQPRVVPVVAFVKTDADQDAFVRGQTCQRIQGKRKRNQGMMTRVGPEYASAQAEAVRDALVGPWPWTRVEHVVTSVKI